MTSESSIKNVTEDERKDNSLENKWTLYFFKNDRNNNWMDNMKKVIDFETIKDFWGVMHHVLPPSKLAQACDYYLFKHDIQPMWEDEKNKNGGMWQVTFDRTQRSSHLDPCWLEILMSLIGEAFDEDSNDICGAVVNIRGKKDRLSVWTTDKSNIAGVMRIGQKIKDVLCLNFSIEYSDHEKTPSSQLTL